jgi:predicted acylesterase/phospholipase RssA/CRP-like cAMP-binding protein
VRLGGERAPEVLVDALERSHILDGAPPAAVREVVDSATIVLLDAGEELLARGDPSDALFIVVNGALEVVLETPGGTQSVSTIGAGDVVGEIGLLTGDARSATVRAVTDCELVSISGDTVRRTVIANPSLAGTFQRRAMERLRRTLLVDQLTNLFGVIDPTVIGTIEHLVEWITIPAGALLFAEGDEGDGAYLVATGRLRVFTRDRDGREIELAEVGRSGLVGELSLIDGQPRRASVYAVRDSQLVRLSRDAYEQLMLRYPGVGLTVAQMVIDRLSGATVPTREPRSFAVVATSPSVDIEVFTEELAAALGDGARRLTATSIDEELGRLGAADLSPDDVGSLRVSYHLEELEQRHDHLVYQVDDTWTGWGRLAMRSVDRIVLVADAQDDPAPRPRERELWELLTRGHHPEVSLVLLHPPDTALPRGTAAWLDPRDLASHHHVRRGDTAHMARLGRLLAGCGTSLVLGGGGARGFAHLGVLDVLEELDQPIDMIAGTSIGAVMAAGPAMGWRAPEAREKATAAFRKLFDYTLPTTSLLRGERITRKLRHSFGDVDIEDLWIPYFSVAANLTRATVEFDDRGPLVPAVRASIAIPGVLPPVPRDGDLLVDGGVLDNLPVGEMRRRNPTGRVIAIDVAPPDGPTAEQDYGLSVSGFRALLARRRGAGPPHLMTTMVRSTLVAAAQTRQRALDEKMADLYIEVAVDGGALLDFSKANDIADAAASVTRPVLEGWFERGGRREPAAVKTKPGRRTIIDPKQRTRRRGVVLLTLRDLQHRAARFGAVIVGTSVVFALLYLMTGLTEQFHREPRQMVSGFGAAGWVVRDGASGAFTSAATMPATTAAQIRGARAAPLVVGRQSLSEGATRKDIVVLGVTPGGVGEPELIDGRQPRTPTEVAVDRAAGLSVGDTAVIGVNRYTVVGRTAHRTLFAGMPGVFMRIDAAQALLYRGQPLASAILVDRAGATVPTGFTVLRNDDIASDAMRPLEHSITSVNLIRVLLWFVSAMIIGTMVYLSALERRRDVAVLKAVGASTGQLGTSIALEGVLVALVAAGIASLLQLAMAPRFPLEVAVPGNAYAQVPGIAVLVALAAGAVGLRRAVQTDPALAFSGAAA